MPRLAHSKSRSGCARCKARKVKCDEKKPRCSACERHDVRCDYRVVSPAEHIRSSTPRQEGLSRDLTSRGRYKSPGQAIEFAQHEHNPSFQLQPSIPRDNWHIIELQLMHHFATQTWSTFFRSDSDLWRVTGPALAIKHQFLLDNILAFAALHLAKLDSRNECNWSSISIELQQRGLREHAEAIQDITFDNFEAVCLSSGLILNLVFASLGDVHNINITTPLQALVDWFNLGRGTRKVFDQCRPWTHESVALAPMFHSEPKLSQHPEFFGNQNRQGLAAWDVLLTHDADNELMTPNIVNSYESTLNYICAMYKAIKRGESPQVTCRRITAMPAICGAQFIELMLEKRPRALVMIAHVFALLEKTNHDMWWTRDVSQLMIQTIYQAVPHSWKHLMDWPIESLKARK